MTFRLLLPRQFSLLAPEKLFYSIGTLYSQYSFKSHIFACDKLRMTLAHDKPAPKPERRTFSL